MQTRSWMVLLALGMSALLACGDDDDDDTGGGKDGGTSDGGSANGGSGNGGSGSGGSGNDAGNTNTGEVSVECGATTCTSSMLTAGFIDACCADESSNTCGQSMMGGACMTPPEPDTRCPGISLGGLGTLSSCCTTDGQCGAVVLGTSCTSLTQVGAAMPLLAVLGVTLPTPRACDEADAAVDAGFEGDAGQ